jgi:hypothetical protein
MNIPHFPKSVQFGINRYYKAMRTATHTYYVCYLESDDNAQVLCFDNKGELLASNIHATNAMQDDTANLNFIWVSPTMQANLNILAEEGYDLLMQNEPGGFSTEHLIQNYAEQVLKMSEEDAANFAAEEDNEDLFPEHKTERAKKLFYIWYYYYSNNN